MAWTKLLLLIAIFASNSVALHKEATQPQSSHPKLSILLLHSFFPSHTFPLISLGAELVSRGHNVSCFGSVTADFETRHKELLKSNGINYLNTTLFDTSIFDEFRQMTRDNGTIFEMLPSIIKFLKLFTSENFYNCSTDVSGFDYLIAEQAAGPLLYDLSSKWNNSNTMLLMLQTEVTPRYLQAWPYPRYLAPFSDNMTFLERLLNTGVYVILEQVLSWLFPLLMRFNGLRNMPSDFLSMVVYQPTLHDTVIGLDWPKAILPLQHYVGPMFLPHPPPLEPSLINWLEREGKEAAPVIVISMGTTADITKGMAEAFISLSSDYRIVWSLRESNQHVLSGLQINKSLIHVTPWLSQLRMLKHHSVKLAILHCGLNGVQESLYNRVPVLCLPYGIDQHDNAFKLRYHKLGLSLFPHEVNNETLRKAVASLQEKVYYDNVNKISVLFKAAGGVKRGADLVELYAEVGYEHGLPSFVRYQWGFIQYYNIDVWIVLGLLVALSFIGCRKLCKRRCCCSRSCMRKEAKRKTE